ncbi:IPT/TIG domain-containing protein [Archangium lipolyticum]|uniref:IPT/TIG domain-containing protein n=1 Tax=Archangium lipolyticum TaxID=2970465 RepID=UPI00214A0230|nr:IPT/TIG domain-containing protein [Archangium lipolyticum]
MRVWNHLGAWVLAVVLCACGPGLSLNPDAGNGGTGGNPDTGVSPEEIPAPVVERSSELTYADPDGETLNLTVHGQGFVPGSIIHWEGQPLTTTYLSETRLTATFPSASFRYLVMNGAVQVFAPAPGGGLSERVYIPLPSPVISELVPGHIAADCEQTGEPISVRVLGKNFLRTSVVSFVGSLPLSTTFVSNQELTARLERSACYSASTHLLYVDTPSVWPRSSARVALEVRNPEPVIDDVWPRVISALEPGGADAGVDAGTPSEGNVLLSLWGTGLLHRGTGTEVRWNGARVSYIWNGDGSISVVLPPELVATSGQGELTLHNPPPGGGTSSPTRISIHSGPVVHELIPSSAELGGAGFTLEVSGERFDGASTVYWNGRARTTRLHPYGGRLLADIPAADLTLPGTARITVVGRDGKVSPPLGFLVSEERPAPVVRSLSSAVFSAGSGWRTLWVYGSGFHQDSRIRWNGEERVTTFVDSTTLRTSLSAADLQSAGVARITVVTPGPGGGTSLPLLLRIEPRLAVPVISSPGTMMAPSGTPEAEVSLVGYGFEPTSVILWNGETLPTWLTTYDTTSVQEARLSARVPASRLASPGTAEVHVLNPEPGGGLSDPVPFTILAPGEWGVPLSPASAEVGTQELYLDVNNLWSYSHITKDSVLQWGSEVLVPSRRDEGSFTVHLEKERLASVGKVEVRVFTPGVGLSAPRPFPIVPPRTPWLGTISPGVVSVGQWGETGSGALRVHGENFVGAHYSSQYRPPDTQVLWNGTARSMSLNSSGYDARIPVTAADVRTAGSVQVRLSKPSAVGETESLMALLHVTLERPVPLLQGLRPAGMPVGSPSFPLRVSGSGFHAASVVQWNDESLPTRLEGETLVATVPASVLAQPGEARVRVVTPEPGGGPSLPLVFQVYP